jgi:hypothetical protein
MTIKNCSAALTVIARFEVGEMIAHADVRAFGAPSECHALVNRGLPKRARTMRRQVHGLTQLPWLVFLRRLGKEHNLYLDSQDHKWARVVSETANRSGYPL